MLLDRTIHRYYDMPGWHVNITEHTFKVTQHAAYSSVHIGQNIQIWKKQ